jgi:hypothetical protein
MDNFVAKDSVVRQIWGNSDTILFIFAGASAEFALNKAVDWLYFTGRLPANPLDRLFSTVAYARKIIFSEYDAAIVAIERINAVHQGVEESRGSKIPEWAYRDVLFMLIDYSIRAHEVLEEKLSLLQKEEVVSVFLNVGLRMKLTDLPSNLKEWEDARKHHLTNDMIKSDFTVDLYHQYRKHLGRFRFQLLMQAQILVVPQIVNNMLKLGSLPLLKPVLIIYKLARLLKLHMILKNIILPPAYKQQVMDLDIHN